MPGPVRACRTAAHIRVMSTTSCTCVRPHVRKVRTSALSVFGEGESWLAARPGGIYLAGHGWHFSTWDDAIAYATNMPTTRCED